ncbi:ACSL1, partial [Symbiodinium microadriaticum]
AAIFGGDQEYNGALIVPDYAELSKWAEENGYEEGSIDFCTHPEVVKLITEEIVKYTSHELKHYEFVKRYTLLREPFSPENNLLTQKMSLKRHNVSKVYAEIIADMFSGNIGHDVQYK